MTNLLDKYLPDDVLLGMFYFLPDGSSFMRDREKLGRFLAKKKEDYAVLKDISFRVREFPESEEIDQAMKNLAVTGMLISYSNSPNTYHVSPASKRVFEGCLGGLFDKTELNELEQLALAFKEEFLQK